jgi:hypothetical protein
MAAFLIIATIFPSSKDRYIWILSHIARNVDNANDHIAEIAILTYLRFAARHYVGQPLDYENQPGLFERIPSDPEKCKHTFGCLLYEVMWNQRKEWPKFPFPYVLYYIIERLKVLRVFETEQIFQLLGNNAATAQIRAEVNEDFTALNRADVHVLANLLKLWLKGLPNPLVPCEMTDEFAAMAGPNKEFAFVEKMPLAHKRSLLYLVGFLKELAEHSQQTGLDKYDFTIVFGPLIVNPHVSVKGSSERIQEVTQMSVAFLKRLIDSRDANEMYPIDPRYLSPLDAN